MVWCESCYDVHDTHQSFKASFDKVHFLFDMFSGLGGGDVCRELR